MTPINSNLKLIDKAQDHSPEAYRLLKEIAIAAASIATGILLAIPAAYAISSAGLSFTAAYFASTTVISVIAKVIIDTIEEKKHWFGRKIAEIVLKKKEVVPKLPTKGLPCTEKIQTHSNENKGLLFGINYSNWKSKQLPNCINDVLFIKRVLKKCGFTEENIISMTDLDKETDYYPTLVNMLRQLLYWVETVNLSKEKMGFLHYSGHGSQVTSKEKDEIILPIDYPDPSDPKATPALIEKTKEIQQILNDLQLDNLSPYIDDNTLFKIIQKLHKDAFAVILEDGSHRGTGFDFPFLVLEDGTHVVMNKKFLPGPDSLDNCKQLATLIKISGSDDGEESSNQGRVEGISAGVTTTAFCSTLKKFNYNLTFRELMVGMRKYLSGDNPEGIVYNQHSQITSTRPFDLDSYFMKRETVLQKINPIVEKDQIKLVFPEDKKEPDALIAPLRQKSQFDNVIGQ